MMRRVAVVLAAFAMSTAIWAQTHVLKKPETVVRAIGVFEWTGEETKPTASRLVPVTVFINGQLEDAGSYLVRPVPFALSTGTIFEVQKAGVAEGTVELAYERHLEGNSIVQFDSGWMGYGLFKPVAQAPVLAARKSGPLPQIVASGGSKPKLGNRTGDSDTKTADADTKTADDSERPTMRRRTDSSATADSPAKTPETTPADDPDRPTMRRRSDSGDTAAADSTPADSSASTDDKNKPTMRRRTPDADAGTVSATDSSDDVDRPTLKKRTAPPQGKGQKRPQDQASVANAVGSLNDDPDRPTLQRGAPSGGANVKGIPPLSGLPADMAQRVAVSDAVSRQEHDFNRQWDSEAERADVMAKMEQIARDRLGKYDMPGPVVAPAVPALAPAKPAVRGKKPVAPPPAPVALADEQLRGFTLSYGGAATFVYTASSPGVDGATRYVSVVAQRESAGEPKVALASVTDSKHLDRAPWMRLVDVVDAEASNRASLLFEMRGQNARQFALYRVIGAVAEQVFQSGTTE